MFIEVGKIIKIVLKENLNRMKNLLYKKAFTLAEVIMVLAILGIVAAITVPATIKNTTDRANRVKVRKALTVYEALIEKTRIENNLQSLEEINNWTNNDGNCTNGRKYFKIIKEFNDNNTPSCKFMTSEKLWWDISTISKPIISFKKEDLTGEKATSNKDIAFFMATRQTENAFRINDYQQDSRNKNALCKILYFAKIIPEKCHKLFEIDKFDFDTSAYEPCPNPDEIQWGRCTNCRNCYTTTDPSTYYYDSEGRIVADYFYEKLREYYDYDAGEATVCWGGYKGIAIDNCTGGESNHLDKIKLIKQDDGSYNAYIVSCSKEKGCSCSAYKNWTNGLKTNVSQSFNGIDCGDYADTEGCTWENVNGKETPKCK